MFSRRGGLNIFFGYCQGANGKRHIKEAKGRKVPKEMRK